MAHAERIGIGEAQAELATHLAVILDDAADFPTDILRGHLHLREEPLDRFLQGSVHHGNSLWPKAWGRMESNSDYGKLRDDRQPVRSALPERAALTEPTGRWAGRKGKKEKRSNRRAHFFIC